MKSSDIKKLKRGSTVVLTKVPPGLIRGLPDDDQRAILEIVGKPAIFNGVDADKRAELKFTDSLGVIHFIFVDPRYIRVAKVKASPQSTNTRSKLGYPSQVAQQTRAILKRGGSAKHAKGVQWFFKEEIKSHGWYAAALRREAVRQRGIILQERDLDFLIQIAGRLFSGEVLEEKTFAVLLLEKLDHKFGDAEFRLFESWLPRISSWADHDALVYCLIGPMVVMKPARIKSVFRWAKSKDRWHRRAACVALIHGTRRKLFFPEIVRLSDFLLRDEDDMVRKGLGWLLRETAKADAKRTVPYLMKIRGKSPRLVLRTACETLAAPTRKKILQT